LPPVTRFGSRPFFYQSSNLHRMRLWPAVFLLATSEAYRTKKERVRNQTLETKPFVFNDAETDVGSFGAAASDAEVTPSAESGIESCLCRFSRYSYQVWARNQDGSGCIGGCGGAEFQINRNGGTIKQLMVWTDGDKNSHIRAIRFTYHDDHQVVKGKTEGAAGPWSFTFAPGEYVKGDVALSGDGRGRRLGSIRFSTTQGRTFDVGMRSPKRYLFPSGDSYIAGFMGRAGNDIDMLGPVFWKPIKSITMENLTYPTLDALPRLSSPKQLVGRSYCNSLPFPVNAPTEKANRTVTEGFETCFNMTSSMQFAGHVKISGTIPIIKKDVEKDIAKWDLQRKTNVSNCKSETKTVNMTLVFPGIEIPAYTKFDFMHLQFSGKLDRVPFEGKLRVRFSDGTSFVRDERGAYTGAVFDDVHDKRNNTKGNVRTC